MPDGYLTNYVGETVAFATRFPKEISYARSGGDRYWDVGAFARGERTATQPRDLHEATENVEKILGLYRVFMAPVTAAKSLLCEIEARVIRQIQDHSTRCRRFLKPDPKGAKGLPLELKHVCSVHLIGLT